MNQLMEFFNTPEVNRRIGFDEIKTYITQRTPGPSHGYSSDLLVSTLPEHLQHCLIFRTLSIQDEIVHINQCLEDQNMNARIYIYGLNHKDLTVERKQQQLKQMGFRHVYIYLGGLFEWLLLQDIYGRTEFPTTAVETDILRFKP